MSDRASDNGPAERRELLRNALAALAKMQREMDALKRAAAEPIAVIGMGCRFPGNVHSPEDYWRLLAGGIDAVRPMPAERWAIARRDLLPAGDVQPPFGGFLDQVDRFDAAFFGISGREAESMDPQQRLLLEVAWETIENAGIDATRLKESRTGVFVGVTTTDYARISMEQGPDKLDAYTATGNALNVTAGRLAFTLGCNGPAMAIDSACSSSLVAIHLACQSLRQKESDMALAGGVNVILALEAFICFNRWGMMAPDGRCKTFDARADGFVRGEGCGLLLLKRLSEAEKNGDPILAVIRGSAVNQDGASSGLTVPNGPAQEAVLRKALESAGLGPETIGYVEAHGTGTRLGDPIEMEALIRVLGEGRTAENPLRVGSVKTNIGHLESASGVAGVIKVILALQHQAIPPHLHFHTLNPQIRTSGTAVEIPTALVPWTERRIAGVSSFGFSGTNAHVILEATGSREMAAPDTTRPLHLLALSAKTPQALAESARRYSDFLGEQKSGAAGDVCFTANTGRAHFKHRLAVSGDGPAELARKLEAFHSGDAHAVLHAEIHSKRAPGLVFLFTGQGSQYVGMGRRLFETQPTFRRVMTHCDEILRPELARPLLAVLYPDPGREEEARQLLDQTGYAQPALFALEIALAELWRSWGIAPAAVMGHSVGEYVAACAAGVFTLEEGLRLIAARGRLMQALPQGGAMAALFTDENTALAAIAAHSDRVSLAALNGPANTVISGAAPAVAAIREALQHSGIASVPLNVSHAFHSPLVEPMLDEFERIAAGVRYAAPRIDLVSNLTGEPIGNHEIDAGYWRRHACRPVRFMQSIRSLYALGCRWFVESGPHPVLCGMAAKIEPLPDALRLPSLAKGSDDWARLLESLGRLYVQGAPVDWTGFDRDYRRRRMLLPTYPFQRAHFWVRTPAAHRPLRSNRGMHHTEMNHPLIDRTIRSPHNANAAFETTLDTAALPYLADHRIFGTTVVPAALFLELGLAAGTLHMQGQACRIEAFNIEAPLLLAQGVPAVLQTTFGPLEEDGATFEIFSLTDEQSSIWQRHASGSIRIEKNVEETEPFVLLGQNQAGELVPQEAYYASLREIGIEYGPAFKGLNEIRHQDGRVTGRLEMPETLEREVSGYFLHPALLDLGFQLLGAALKGKNQGDVYLPIGVELYQVHRPGARPASCRGTLRSAGADGNEIHIGDLRMFDPAGELLAEIQGLRIKRATQQAFQKALVKRHDTDGWLHELQWTALDPLPEPVSENVDGLWLIFTDAAGAGRVLGAALQQHGARIHSVTAGDAYAELEPDHTQVRATEPGDFERLYARVNLQEALRGVVYSWGIGRWGMLNRLATEGGADDGADGWTGLLHLVQILRGSENQRMPLLTIVTSGAVSFGAPAEKVDPAQTLLWGFGRSIAAERPELGCRLVDLDPAGMIEECGAALLREVSCVAREENQVALRSAGRWGLRLAPPQPPSAAPAREAGPYRIDIVARGTLDRFEQRPLKPAPPAAGEVQIQVEATGLNFRDVLNALGMYPGDAGPLGNECVGRVAAVGEGITRFQPGDAVLAITPMAFCSHVNARADLVVHRPGVLSVPEAATIPIAFLTAHYAFNHVAHLKAGQRVLIHAAAGGVGMAAVQLARLAGAEILATAGSPAKRALLREMGIVHVMDSRSLAFADQVREITQGRGVDVVLNSLAGDFIPAGLGLVAPGGHFLEIGKSDQWNAEQAARRFPGVTYTRVFVGEVCHAAPDLVNTMFKEVMEHFRLGLLKPLPLQLFGIAEVSAAFRFMALAKHVGKIVIDQRPVSDAAVISSDATYLITGGLGGLGLCFADWLAQRGARHIVLNARRQPGEKARAQIEHLKGGGVEVKVSPADLSKPQEVRRLIEGIDPDHPLKGIIHAAGIIDDATLAHLTQERMAAVLGPKVTGALWLHRLTRNRELDFFVLCSAGAALFGSPGQSNYAAANAFLDGLAWQRRAEGLPALSINWGPWADVGMAAGLGKRDLHRWEAMGIGTIKPAQGIQALELVLGRFLPQVAILRVDWEAFRRSTAGATMPPFIADLVSNLAQQERSRRDKTARRPIREQLLEAAPDKRRQMLNDHLATRAAGELLVPLAQLDRETPLPMLGFDSLMAVQLKNRIEAELGVKVDMVYLLEGRTLNQFADFVWDRIAQKPEIAYMTTHAAEGPEQKEANAAVWDEGAI